MFCRECGTKNDTTSAFCCECGAKLVQEQVNVNNNIPTNNANVAPKKPMSKKSKIIIAVVTSLFVLGTGSGLFLLYGPWGNFRNWLITTAMTTMNHQYLATWFYSDETIQKVLDNNKVIGFIIFAIIYDRGELIDLYINESYRNKGLAKNLLNIMLDNSKECNNISLEVRVDNISAYNLYLNFGFKVVSKRERYYKGIDGYLMVKEVKKQ